MRKIRIDMKALIQKRIVVEGSSETKKTVKTTILFCGIPIYHSAYLVNQF